MRQLAWLVALVGCQDSHAVTVQLGPTSETLSAGFACVQDADPTKLLASRAVQPDRQMHFALIVDVVTLGGQLPGCRGEELSAACADSQCRVVPPRYCQDVVIDEAAVASAIDGDLVPMLESLRTQLRVKPITLDAPDEPVLLRAVATTDPCSALDDDFDPSHLVGCAYSCPAQLDDIDGPIALSLDTLDRGCEREVRACAAFR